MFALESEMTPHVTRWLEREGLLVRKEFSTPWGLCDLVAMSFRAAAVEHRLKLRQSRAITSISRAAILIEVPDVETGNSISLDGLAKRMHVGTPDDLLIKDVDRLISDRFLIRNAAGELQKRNGWMPMHDRLVAVELKLSRVDEAFRQARRNLGFASESYAGFPMALARRIAANPKRWSRHFQDGVGLIGVDNRSCRVLIESTVRSTTSMSDLQLYSVEKFWQTRPR